MKQLDIHDNAENELYNVFKSVIENGENNSAMVIGPRGSGKSFLVKKCLDKLTNNLRAKNASTDFLLVNLSGCFQYDDKSALIEISKQLKLENVINEKVFGSFSDSFEFLIRSMRAGDAQSKPLIFIMDEFDLFTKNKTQLLLYTILNTIQTSSTPMCLIGITCRIDVLDLLEKRIKSRFSHRQIYLFNDFTFTKYLEMAKYFLINSEEIKPSKSKYIGPFLEELFDDSKVIKLLQHQFDYDKSITTLKRLMLLPTIRMSYIEKEYLTSKDVTPVRDEFYKSYEYMNIDKKFSMLKGVSILELTLIVVMLEMCEIYPEQPFNFDLIFNAYYKFCQKRNWGQQKYEKQIVLKAYEHLISLNFILPANDYGSSTRSSKQSKEHTLMYLALDKEEIEQCLDQYQNCPTELKYHSKVL